MSPTILELKNHRYHLQHALRHFHEIRFIEENLPTACSDIMLEHHSESLRWELEQAQAAVFSCHSLQAGNAVKRQHVARIASIRLSRLARQVQGTRLP